MFNYKYFEFDFELNLKFLTNTHELLLRPNEPISLDHTHSPSPKYVPIVEHSISQYVHSLTSLWFVVRDRPINIFES